MQSHYANAGGIERAVHNAFEDLGIAEENPLDKCGNEAHDEKAYPDIVKCHVLVLKMGSSSE